MTFDHVVVPLGLLLIAVVGGFLADRAARVRRPDGDRGDFWTMVVKGVCLLLALPVLISGSLALFPDFWQTGRHLHFDVTGVFGWSLRTCYRLALLVPFAVWGLLLFFGIARKPQGREAGRWLAGSIGFGDSRLWILVCAVPLAVILAATYRDLGGGPAAYSAVTWGTTAVLLLSLIGVALSSGHTIVPLQKADPVKRAADLRPWPEALAAHGLRLRHIASWDGSPPARPVRRSTTGELLERLKLRGGGSVAPELIEAVEGLFTPGDDEKSSRLIFAPDGCGQVEAVALAAERLGQRFHAATLVVTAGDAEVLARDLARWLPAGRRVSAIGATGNAELDALVVVTDAQTLSDRLLPQLKNPLLLKRFGLIVWWHLEAYTGVLAANLWAISRRLHRLLQVVGRHDIRTLTFMRNTPHGSAQLAAFVRRLLPHPLPASSEVHVEPRFPRTLHLHVLESHNDFFAGSEGRNVQERHRHLPLVAAKVSVEEGWPTHLEIPPDIAASEAGAFLQLRSGGEILGDRLLPDSAPAGAVVRKIDTGEVLSLLEIVGQGGRAADDGLPHHVGITLPADPYVRYLMSTLKSDGAFPASRRLVSAAAQPSVVRRHLLLALDELPDTRSGLLKNFLWNEEIIHQTLEEIAREGKLTRKEVRFLDERGELRREHEYKSQRPPAGERRPLDTVGASLVDVRDPAAGHEVGEGVRMRVDPERVTIQAYPHRVFIHGGQRYRIREWTSVNPDPRSPWLACDREDVYCATWRIRNASVFGIKAAHAPVGVGRRGRLLTRLTASLTYEEEVVGALRITPNLTTGAMPKPETFSLAEPVTQSFVTRALILRFPQEDQVGLASVAQALRHVLPVHLGIEEDALEVVPLSGAMVDDSPTFGLAIVDLYPGGIGLVDAIGDDSSFLLQLFEWAESWVAACPCQSRQGCERCLRSPSALAANSDRPPLRGAALDLLRQVV
jgi:hypothetical protein